MPRSKAVPEEDLQQVPEDMPALEPMSPRLKMVMDRWGTVTKQTIDELELFAPGWANIMTYPFTFIRDIVSEAQ